MAQRPTICCIVKKPEDLTGGTSSSKSYGNYQPPRGEVGWICPVCGRGLAPSTSYCPCNLTRNITYLNGGVTIKDILDQSIDCNSAPPEAYYTTTATTATNKCNDGVYIATDSVLTTTFDSKGKVFGKSTYTN